MTPTPGPVRGAVALPPELRRVADKLNEIAAVVDQCRAAGVVADVPRELAEACRAVLDRARTARPAAGADLYTIAPALPVRRLVLHLVDEGEDVTVAEMVRRCAAAGVQASRNQISNALGFHASRGAMVRVGRGTYQRTYQPTGERIKEP